MRLLLMLSGLIFCLGACAPSVPMADATADAQGKAFEAPASGMAALYIVDIDRFSDGPALNVSVGNRMLGGLASNTWFRVEVSPGRHDVRATGRDGSGSLIVDLQSGQIEFVSVKHAHSTLTGVVSVVDSPTGRRLVQNGRRALDIQ